MKSLKGSTPSKIIVVINILMLGIIGWLVYIILSVNNTTVVEENVSEESYHTVMQDSIFNHLQTLHVEHIGISVNLFNTITDSLRKDLFTKSNNHFGLAYTLLRPTTAIGQYKGFAVYKSWQDCNIDYALWQTYYGLNKNDSDYVDLFIDYYTYTLDNIVSAYRKDE